jgi:hypothetical protein
MEDGRWRRQTENLKLGKPKTEIEGQRAGISGRALCF